MGRAEGESWKRADKRVPEREEEGARVAREAAEAYEQGGQWAMDNVLKKWDGTMAARDKKTAQRDQMQKSMNRAMKKLKGVR